MTKHSMCYLEREQSILEYLHKHGVAITGEICKLTGASPATIRRDITLMVEKELIVREHRAIKLATTAPTPITLDLPEPNPSNREKDAIARYAASFVQENDSVFIGAGITCSLFAKYIRDIPHVNIVTTSITAAMELLNTPNISLTLLGGEMYAGTNFVETVASQAAFESQIEPLFFDKVFITVDGISLERGYTIRYQRQVPLYSHLIKTAGQFFVFADSSKYNRSAFVPAFPMRAIHNIIATSAIPDAYKTYYAEHKKSLHLVPVDEKTTAE